MKQLPFLSITILAGFISLCIIKLECNSNNPNVIWNIRLIISSYKITIQRRV